MATQELEGKQVPIILITSSPESKIERMRSKHEEYRDIADLTGFENLKAMLQAEAFRRRKNRKKKKRNLELQAQKVEAAEEKEQENLVNDGETINETGAGDSSNSVEVIGHCSLSLEDNELASGMNLCRNAEMVPTEAILKQKRRRRRRRWRRKIKFIVTDETVDIAMKRKQPDSGQCIPMVVSLNSESAETRDNIVLRKLLRKPRYFDPPNDSWVVCSNCGEEDHRTFNCTAQKRKKPCFLCGSSRHRWKRCRENLDCFVRNGRGHLTINCLEKHQENTTNSSICLRCGDTGHAMFSCKNDYSPDDLQKMQCYICKSLGHLCCIDFSNMGPQQVSCYNCGQPGHLGSSCRARSCLKSTALYKCGDEGQCAQRIINYRKDGEGVSDLSTRSERLSNGTRSSSRSNAAKWYVQMLQNGDNEANGELQVNSDHERWANEWIINTP